MIYAGIVAGGTGSRMGQDIPKQFIHINDEPIIIHTIRRFINHCDKIIVACHRDYVSYLYDLVKKYIGASPDISIIAGGNTRMESILALLSEISLSACDEDIILTHDGVRPFADDRIISENISYAKKYGCCGTFINAVDTMAVSIDGSSLTSVPVRDTLYNVQTPQTFKIGILKNIFIKAKDDTEKYTDLCGLAMAMGCNVKMVVGDSRNIKITSPIDLQIAGSIMEALS